MSNTKNYHNKYLIGICPTVNIHFYTVSSFKKDLFCISELIFVILCSCPYLIGTRLSSIWFSSKLPKSHSKRTSFLYGKENFPVIYIISLFQFLLLQILVLSMWCHFGVQICIIVTLHAKLSR